MLLQPQAAEAAGRPPIQWRAAGKEPEAAAEVLRRGRLQAPPGSEVWLFLPGKPVAYNNGLLWLLYGLLWLLYGLLWGIVACYFGLLGVPGTNWGGGLETGKGLL